MLIKHIRSYRTYARQHSSGKFYRQLYLDINTNFNNLIPHLRIKRNQGPNSIHGGGVRRQPTQPGLAI
jgi:hypothetical protein